MRRDEPAIEFEQVTTADKGLKALGGLIYGFGGLALMVAWGSYVLTILWGWFITPLFALPALSLLQAAGLSLVINLIIAKPDVGSIAEKLEPMSHERRIWKMFKSAFQKPAFARGIGWIIHKLMMMQG